MQNGRGVGKKVEIGEGGWSLAEHRRGVQRNASLGKFRDKL